MVAELCFHESWFILRYNLVHRQIRIQLLVENVGRKRKCNWDFSQES